MVIHYTWFQSFVGKIFLDGLNEEFDLRRQLIFSKAEWPGLDDIISSVLEEDTRLAQSKANNSREIGDRAALSMQNMRFVQSLKGKGNGKLKCDHCGDKRHTIDRCFKLHGFPPGWKKGKFQQGGDQSGKLNKANNTTSENQSQVVDVQALEEFKSSSRSQKACLPPKIPPQLIPVFMPYPKEIRTGRILGTGTVHNGLYYLDEGSDEVALATKMSPCQELLLLNRRLGHPSFATMSCCYPSLFGSCRSCM
nr:uncharacterized protein LOC117842220 [Setaria viridis]